MPELEPQNELISGPSASLPDPMASLHKMSMTAGVGSQEYVAINNLAMFHFHREFNRLLAGNEHPSRDQCNP